MNRNIIIIIFFLILSPFPLLAQTDTIQIKTEEVLEEILQEPFEETDNSDLYDIIENLIISPIEINSAGIEELQKIPGLNISDAQKIIDHKKRFGPFFNVNELYSVQYISKEVIDKIIPFIFVLSIAESEINQDLESLYEPGFFDKSKILYRGRALNDLQPRTGFQQNRYDGNKLKFYNRILARYESNYQIGLTAEKDPGEKSYTDFTSFHLQIKKLGVLNNLVAGDYLLEFGQGLALWGPYGFSKGADALFSVKKRARTIAAYTGATENNFFRGGAVELLFGDLRLAAFYSQNKFDANIDSTTFEITSLPVDGFHRTETEKQKRKSAQEKTIGGSLSYSFPNFSLGFLTYNSSFSNAFEASSIFDLKGDNFTYYSAFYNFYWGSINIFGEASYDGTSVASINGIQIAITKNFDYVTLVRSYPRNYKNLHGFGFGERSGANSNEIGFYNGLIWKSPIGTLNFYYDQFKFPFSTFSNPLPSTGNEFLINLSSKPLPKLETRLRYKYEKKEISDEVNLQEQMVSRLRQSYRAEVIYELSKKVRLKGRFEFNTYTIKENPVNEEGFLFFQDLRINPVSSLVIYGRIIFFKTDSFNSAVYEYENDLVGVLSNLAMYGEGVRWYLMLRYKPLRSISISIKYAETYKPSEKTLSSGLSEINGNLDNRLSIQLDLNL